MNLGCNQILRHLFPAQCGLPQIKHVSNFSQQLIPVASNFSDEGTIRRAAMDSIKGQGGIQMLLTAEQEAQHIVSSARNLKIARLKQAKEEAEKEVALYRSNLEAEYQKNLSEAGGSSGVKRLEEETEMRIKNLKKSATRVSPDTVAMVIKYVTTVKA